MTEWISFYKSLNSGVTNLPSGSEWGELSNQFRFTISDGISQMIGTILNEAVSDSDELEKLKEFDIVWITQFGKTSIGDKTVLSFNRLP